MVTGSLSQDARIRLPTEAAVKKQAQRARRKENPRPAAPTSLSELVLEEDDCMTLAGETMLLHDNEDDQRRVIIFGTDKNLRVLSESCSWYVDATFSSSPQLFYQVLTVHAEIVNFNEDSTWCFPCVFILLTHKDTALYKEAFDALDALGTFAPDNIMVDFEPALRNALSQTFPSAHIDGCYFHFCQAVYRAVQRLGYKESYEATSTDPATGRTIYSTTRTWIRRLMLLAYIPTADVTEAFFSILNDMPADLGIDDLLGYFQTTWIQGLTTSSGTGQAKYPPLTWNAYDRTHFHMNRTNNFVESWNKKFSLTLGHSNPTIYNFISALQLEQSSTDGKILAYNVGEMPPRRKRRNVEKDRRIHTVVENYDAYEGNVIAYLDLLNSVC